MTRNRTTFPAPVVERADDNATYDIDEFYMGPTRIAAADKVELSYNKMQSVLYDLVQKLSEDVGNWMLYNWRATAATSQVRTSGGAADAHLSGGTGHRKKVLAADLQAASLAMREAKIPNDEWYALLDPTMHDQLLSDLKFGEFRDTIKEADLSRGFIGKLFNLNIIQRHTVLGYTNAATPVPNAPGAANANQNAAALCWSKGMVERALGEIDFYEELKSATYFGDLYSGLIRSGGRKRRYDGVGVVAIIETGID
ncbi:hypothetical protein ES703_105280 [subsurface metagenome]